MELTVENNVVVVSLSVDQDSGYSAAAYARRAEAAEAVAVSAKDQVSSDRSAAEVARDEAIEAEQKVKASLSGILPEPKEPLTIDKNYSGPVIHINRLLKADGTLRSSVGFLTYELSVLGFNSLSGDIRLFNRGSSAPFNAAIIALSNNGVTDLLPLPVDAGGVVATIDIDITTFDTILISYSAVGADNLNLILTPSEIAEEAPVKAYVDKKGSPMSSPNGKFSLERLGTIFSASQSLLSSIYWPWIISTENINAPLSRYYMYYSTDHGGGSSDNSKICMAFSDDLQNWTEHGVVLTSLDQFGISSESETPSVIWDEYSGKLRMYWQTQTNLPGQTQYAQATMISESTDGLTWTFVKQALDIPRHLFPGDGHNGYFTPMKTSNYYIATHLFGGTAQSYAGISYSYDGLHWHTDRNNISRQVHGQFAANVYSGSNNETGVFCHNGTYYSVSSIGIPAAGTNPKVVNIGITELCDDFITIRGKAYLIMDMNPSLGENTDIRSLKSFQDTDGSIYIIYNCNDRFFLSKLNIR